MSYWPYPAFARDLPSLRRMSRDIERVVLAHAVGWHLWHLEDRVFVTGQRTVVLSQ